MQATLPRSLRAFAAVSGALVLLVGSIRPAVAVSPVDPGADGDDRVTSQQFVRHDGGTDRAIRRFGNELATCCEREHQCS